MSDESKVREEIWAAVDKITVELESEADNYIAAINIAIRLIIADRVEMERLDNLNKSYLHQTAVVIEERDAALAGKRRLEEVIRDIIPLLDFGSMAFETVDGWEVLEEIEKRLRSALAPAESRDKPKVCRWTWKETDDCWVTSCGKRWPLIADIKKDQKCYNCGLPIEESEVSHE